jgi:hypothetical protein
MLTEEFKNSPHVALKHMAVLIDNEKYGNNIFHKKKFTKKTFLKFLDFQHFLKKMKIVLIWFREGDTDDVTFLYKLIDGTCPKSYGMKVASMAGLHSEVVQAAKAHAENFEKKCCLTRYKQR